MTFIHMKSFIYGHIHPWIKITLSFKAQSSKPRLYTHAQAILLMLAIIFVIKENLFSSFYNLRTIVTPLMFVTSNNPIVTCFASHSLEMKLTTMAKTSHVQLNIHRSKVQMVDKQSTNVGTTYVVMVFSTKFGKISSTNAFSDGKTTHGHNQYTIFYNQMDSTILIGNKPLTTNNIRSSTKPTCVKSSFLNLK